MAYATWGRFLPCESCVRACGKAGGVGLALTNQPNAAPWFERVAPIGPPHTDGNLLGPWIKNWQFAPSTPSGHHPKAAGSNVLNTVGLVRALLHQYNYTHV